MINIIKAIARMSKSKEKCLLIWWLDFLFLQLKLPLKAYFPEDPYFTVWFESPAALACTSKRVTQLHAVFLHSSFREIVPASCLPRILAFTSFYREARQQSADAGKTGLLLSLSAQILVHKCCVWSVAALGREAEMCTVRSSGKEGGVGIWAWADGKVVYWGRRKGMEMQLKCCWV